jgi:hypothetical protein
MPIDRVPYRRAIYVAIGVCTLTAIMMAITPKPVTCLKNSSGRVVCLYERAPDACVTDSQCEAQAYTAGTGHFE